MRAQSWRGLAKAGAGWGGELTYHLVQGIAQEAVLVEDEEPALPFLQQNTEELGGFWPPPHAEPLHLRLSPQ